MTDWVTNGLYIEGSPEDVALVKSQLGKGFERRVPGKSNDRNEVEIIGVRKYSNPVFAFWNISNPLNQDLDAKNSQPNSRAKSYEFDQDWYQEAWGTAWDVAIADGEEFPTTILNVESEAKLAYQFDTAWNPCVEVIRTLAMKNSGIEIVYDYELSSGEGASIAFQGAQSKLIEEYNWKCPECDFPEKEEPQPTCQNCGYENEEF